MFLVVYTLVLQRGKPYPRQDWCLPWGTGSHSRNFGASFSGAPQSLAMGNFWRMTPGNPIPSGAATARRTCRSWGMCTRTSVTGGPLVQQKCMGNHAKNRRWTPQQPPQFGDLWDVHRCCRPSAWMKCQTYTDWRFILGLKIQVALCQVSHWSLSPDDSTRVASLIRILNKAWDGAIAAFSWTCSVMPVLSAKYLHRASVE